MYGGCFMFIIFWKWNVNLIQLPLFLPLAAGILLLWCLYCQEGTETQEYWSRKMVRLAHIFPVQQKLTLSVQLDHPVLTCYTSVWLSDNTRHCVSLWYTFWLLILTNLPAYMSPGIPSCSPFPEWEGWMAGQADHQLPRLGSKPRSAHL